jgi:pyruvate kinase
MSSGPLPASIHFQGTVPFPYAQTRTKIIWSLSGQSFQKKSTAELANQLAHFGIDAVRVTYTPEMAPQLRKLRTSLTLEMEKRGTQTAAEGWCASVVSPVGRRAHLFVPGGQKEVQASEVCEIFCSLNTDACLGHGEVSTRGALEIAVTSADMLTSLKVGSVLNISYGQTQFLVQHIEKLPENKGILLKIEVRDQATLLTHMDVHSADIPRGMFPLTQDDAVAFQNRFEKLADYIILSNINSAEELRKARSLLLGNQDEKASKRHPTVVIQEGIRERATPVAPRLLLKIDSKESLDLLDEALHQLDGIMLSRSELGLSVPLHQLPIIQKTVIARCNHAAKIVVVASELMYSMRTNPNPTRAEVSDMANAAADGADAIFLADEVTEGPHPELVADVSKETLANSEHLHESNWHRVPFEIANDDDAVAYGALEVAEHSGVKAIVCLTEGGYTALRLSSLRTPVEILAVTYNHNIMRQLSLLRSVRVLSLERAPAFDQILEETKKLLVRYCQFQRTDLFVFVSLTASPIAARNSNIFTLQEID